ncbi:MAG: response regulator transcription factor [Myxococcota bacterium]
MMTREIRILLVEPQALVREGLRLVLETRPGYVVVGEADDGQKAVELATRLRPNVVVTELLLPLLSGLEVVRHVCRGPDAARAVVVTGRDARSSVEDALRAGAAGYVVKSAPPKELLEAVALVCSGESFLSPTVTHHLVDAIARPADGGGSALNQLTGREREALQLIAEGNSSKEVAVLMGVSLKTIESHRSSLMTKLGIHKVANLVRFAVREGLVEP